MWNPFGKTPSPPIQAPPDLEGALRTLHAGGLQGRVVATHPPRIVGGRSATVDDGRTDYTDSFSIAPLGRGWLVRLENGERHVDELRADRLDAAVRMVLGVRKR